MLITNIMLAFIAAGLFQIAHVMNHMRVEIIVKTTTHVTTKKAELELVKVEGEVE